jgi:geranylgeranyl diphosphate synthase, type I
MTDQLVSGGPATEIARIRDEIDDALKTFLFAKNRMLADTQLSPLIRQLCEFVDAGGKRLRPTLCCLGWRAAGGDGQRDEVLRAAASLELFHMFALIHDDIMDSSEIRRGQPTLHRSLAAPCQGGCDSAAIERFGINSAILLGDLAFAWSDELFHASGFRSGQLRAVRPVIDSMRTELMLGQYLDLFAHCNQVSDVSVTLTTTRYKTAKYTVERPLHVGASLAGATKDVLDACTQFALPIGEAFQLRDDLLGVFGDPAITGKSRLDDLRDGKSTTLLALARQSAGADDLATLQRLIGNPALDEDGAMIVRRILTDTGAVATLETMISERRCQALAQLDDAPFEPAATASLRHLAHAATARTS